MDLDEKSVKTPEIQSLLDREGVFYFEVSAKTGHNIDELFVFLVKEMSNCRGSKKVLK
jgi:hypothetical protein